MLKTNEYSALQAEKIDFLFLKLSQYTFWSMFYQLFTANEIDYIKIEKNIYSEMVPIPRTKRH